MIRIAPSISFSAHTGAIYNGFTVTLKKRYSHDAAALASYTVSRTTDDASDFDEQPANPYDLKAERARPATTSGKGLLSARFLRLVKKMRTKSERKAEAKDVRDLCMNSSDLLRRELSYSGQFSILHSRSTPAHFMSQAVSPPFIA